MNAVKQQRRDVSKDQNTLQTSCLILPLTTVLHGKSEQQPEKRAASQHLQFFKRPLESGFNTEMS